MADPGGTKRGLLHTLSPEQRARVLAYDGPDAHGDPAFAIAKGLESLPTRVVRLERENGQLRSAAIAVARSEAAASTPAPGEPEGQAHEPWPEMEALRAALDVVLPGWRG